VVTLLGTARKAGAEKKMEKGAENIEEDLL
jgi:hypothetical protein